MDNFYFIGVDVSKKKLDFCVLFEGKVLREEQVSNHQQAVARLIGELKNDLEMDNEQFLICAEHTGQYTFPLVCACKSVECKLWLENPSQIKYSSGMQRGKNDKVDAKRIAIYASRFGDKVKYYDRPSEEIERLKQLERERALYVTDLAKYKGQMYDQKDFMPAALYRKKTKRMKGLIQELQAAIDAITAEMEKIIGSTEVLARQMELLMSIDGVGKVVALNVIIETEAFSRFDNPRKFCCHAGVAPFSYTSGSSQHSKNKVSHRANKNIKKLLHMAAVSVTHRKEGELKAYYMRKVEEGKNKMSVINALRAKIVARMFAVIKRNEFYTPIYDKKTCKNHKNMEKRCSLGLRIFASLSVKIQKQYDETRQTEGDGPPVGNYGYAARTVSLGSQTDLRNTPKQHDRGDVRIGRRHPEQGSRRYQGRGRRLAVARGFLCQAGRGGRGVRLCRCGERFVRQAGLSPSSHLRGGACRYSGRGQSQLGGIETA